METVKDFFANLSAWIKDRLGHLPEAQPANETRFNLISWVVTGILVVGLLGGTIWWKSVHAEQASLPQPTAAPNENPPDVALPNPGSGAEASGAGAINRDLHIKTNIPDRPRYDSVIYRVSRGDAMDSIADQFKIKTNTILYNNKDLGDNPHNLKPGDELIIPPVDGMYYVWKDGDTLDKVAEEFYAKPEDIIDFPGNKIDLTDPEIVAGTNILIPGASRELRDWTKDLQTVSRVNNGSTGTSDFGGNACGGGAVASGFGWPADAHSLSGYGYSPSHLGIDITAPDGASVYAAGAGVVTMAQGGDNYGYGNVIEIDHGNGYVTVYAHLSQINVSVCQSVGQGTVIGYAGHTGNAFGAHLHFEIRVNGSNINPYDIVQ